jgi:hypothetical protein
MQMNAFEKQAFIPPPPSPLSVVGRHGAKFKVWIFGKNRIMTRDEIISLAKSRREIGAAVNFNGYIHE